MGMARGEAMLVVVATLVAACSPDASSAHTAAAWCQAALADDGTWTVAVQVGADRNGALALESGSRVAGCRFVEDVKSGVRTGVSQWAEAPATSPQPLTYSVMLPADEASGDDAASLMTGRLPDGAARVRVLLADGTTSEADVGGGLWLAWLQPAGAPVAIEALDGSGTVVDRIEDPGGLERPVGGPGDASG
jgi:hypothetical protein